MRIVIIGGVAAGMSAATRLRRLDENAQIIVLERGGHVSFANCGLPYHLGGVIKERSSLLLQTPESLRARFGLDVRVGHEAIAIEPNAKYVRVKNLETGGEEDLNYDALILAPGASPVRPPLPGMERALSLRNIEDVDALVARAGEAKTAVVIGGGFIGVEVAENLMHRGIDTTIVEALDQVMAPIDPEMVTLVHERLQAKGVKLRLGQSVAAIGASDVTLADGSVLPADLVVAAIGVRPESSLAAAAGLATGERGGIRVDEHFRTSAPDIYAVGDAVQKVDAVDGGVSMVPLAQTANLQGRKVADAIMSRPSRDRPVLGTAIVGVFGLQVAATGWNEKRLRAERRPYRAIHSHPVNHAGYYPGATPLALKLLVDPDTDTILGAQAIGENGADKRIDVIATAMTAGLKASELAGLELAYAPQYGSAKDPVNMLGWMAENQRDGLVETIQWHELAEAVRGGAVLVDVRSDAEYQAAKIEGSINIPLDELRSRLDEVPAGDLVIYCAVGLRGYLASRILMQYRAKYPWGRIRNLDGGYRTWQLAGSRSR